MLLLAISVTGCGESGIPSPTQPPKGQQNQGNGDKEKEDDKEKEPETGPNGEWDTPQITLNGSVIGPLTTLYGVVTDADSGAGIQGVVVSDGFTCVQTDVNGVYQIVRDERSEMVNISIPAEYEVPVDSRNLPNFYKRFLVEKGEKFRHDFSLKALPGGKQTKFTILALADPQCTDTNDTERFRDETMPDIDALAPTLVNPYAIVLGDITNKNNSAIWAKEMQIMSNRKVTFFHCMGNHDHLNEQSPNDHSQTTSYWKSVENFHKYCGPQNYSFDRGDVHFVVIDTCLHGEKPDASGATHEYATGLYDWGYKWFLEDLSFVPRSKAVVLCCHIPFRDGGGDNHNDKRYRQEILNKLSEYKEAHILLGHTHHMYNWIHNVNGKRIQEHINGAVCGMLWHGPFNKDGTPNGYGVYEFDGTTLSNYWYKGTNCDKDFQIRCYDGGAQISSPMINVNRDVKPKFHSSYAWNLIGQVVANIWNIEHDEWEVSLWQNGQKVCNMEKMGREYDYYTLYWYCEIYGSNGDTYKFKSHHLYKGRLADPTAPFEVRAVDKLNRRGPYIGSGFATDFEGMKGDFDTKLLDEY